MLAQAVFLANLGFQGLAEFQGCQVSVEYLDSVVFLDTLAFLGFLAHQDLAVSLDTQDLGSVAILEFLGLVVFRDTQDRAFQGIAEAGSAVIPAFLETVEYQDFQGSVAIQGFQDTQDFQVFLATLGFLEDQVFRDQGFQDFPDLG